VVVMVMMLMMLMGGPGRAGGLGGAGCGQVGLGAKHFDLDFGVLVCVACGGRGLR